MKLRFAGREMAWIAFFTPSRSLAGECVPKRELGNEVYHTLQQSGGRHLLLKSESFAGEGSRWPSLTASGPLADRFLEMDCGPSISWTAHYRLLHQLGRGDRESFVWPTDWPRTTLPSPSH